mmetsp:Transcript_7255/g.19419  ORF Transcript_7255/g.19419 Transcript_7255/m.19419 type:complete len:285 (+) Transcript_7255:125-979(+)
MNERATWGRASKKVSQGDAELLCPDHYALLERVLGRASLTGDARPSSIISSPFSLAFDAVASALNKLPSGWLREVFVFVIQSNRTTVHNPIIISATHEVQTTAMDQSAYNMRTTRMFKGTRYMLRIADRWSEGTSSARNVEIAGKYIPQATSKPINATCTSRNDCDAAAAPNPMIPSAKVVSKMILTPTPRDMSRTNILLPNIIIAMYVENTIPCGISFRVPASADDAGATLSPKSAPTCVSARDADASAASTASCSRPRAWKRSCRTGVHRKVNVNMADSKQL